MARRLEVFFEKNSLIVAIKLDKEHLVKHRYDHASLSSTRHCD